MVHAGRGPDARDRSHTHRTADTRRHKKLRATPRNGFGCGAYSLRSIARAQISAEVDMHGLRSGSSGGLAVTDVATWLSHREQTSISSAAGRACPADVVELRQLARSFSISCCMLHHYRDGGCGNGGPTCDSCCLEVELSYARTLRSTRDCGRRVLCQARRVALRSIGERAARPNDIETNGDTWILADKKGPCCATFPQPRARSYS